MTEDKAQIRIKELEEELKKTKYNKRTQHSIGLLKAKIAALKEKQEKKVSKGTKFEGYTVARSGDATVVLVGFPSVGKSTLLNKLTNAESEVGAYAFTTLKVIPGLLDYKGAKIQILDVPGIVRGAAAGTGRGKEVLSVMRNADLAIIVIDPFHPEHLNALKKEIRDSHLRINQEKPDVKIIKTVKGGIDIGTTVPLPDLNEETVKAILKEFRINNAQIVIRTQITADELIDIIEANKKYIPAITTLNKSDLVSSKDLKKIKKKIKADIHVSGETGTNIDNLKELIFQKLRFIRIYTKEARKKADLKDPLIMKSESTIRDVCMKLHRDFVKKFKYSKVWGNSAKFGGQKFGLDHTVADGDVVEIHIT